MITKLENGAGLSEEGSGKGNTTSSRNVVNNQEKVRGVADLANTNGATGVPPIEKDEAVRTRLQEVLIE